MRIRLDRVWLRVWRGQPPSGWLFLAAALTALLMSAPVAYIVIRSIAENPTRWLVILDEQVPRLLGNTFALAAVVGVAAGAIGVALAWLTARTDVPGRSVLRWLLALPLSIPPYVGAMCYLILLGPRGWLSELFGASPVDMYSFGGAAFVLTVFTFPYVYLVVGAAISRLSNVHEDAARSMGLGAGATLRRVTLPLLRPAVGAGVILVVLYVLSDFGAVALLRYPTFTTAIYYQMGGFDTGAASILSIVLVAVTLCVLGFEGLTRQRARFYQSSGVPVPPRPITLGVWRWPAFLFAGTVFALSSVLPMGVLLFWTAQAVSGAGFDPRFAEFAANTLGVAGAAAAVAMVLSLPVAYLRSRHPSIASRLVESFAQSGYALPGVIVALGIIFFALRLAPAVYGTAVLLSLAYVVRFFPQAMQAVSAGLAAVSPRIDEAARVAGLGPFKVIARVISRVAAPGILAGGALVFVSAAKELPATLLLRPAGLDTLSVRVWVEASEGAYQLAAPPALVMVILSLVPLKLMIDRLREATQ